MAQLTRTHTCLAFCNMGSLHRLAPVLRLFCVTKLVRSGACRGSEMMREIVWVIFDEIHYMQDRDRGVVWEETIIGLPDACRMVFLSATLANASEFAGWVASLHAQPCHVVYTDFRPTPLEHFGLPCTAADAQGSKGGLYKIYNKHGALCSRCAFRARACFVSAVKAHIVTNQLPNFRNCKHAWNRLDNFAANIAHFACRSVLDKDVGGSECGRHAERSMGAATGSRRGRQADQR